MRQTKLAHSPEINLFVSAERGNFRGMIGQPDTIKAKHDMLAALEASHCIVTRAAQVAQISRQTHYEWTSTDPEYKAAVEALNEAAIDFVESRLYKLIENEDTAATIFYMKTKAKKRGYVERIEQTGPDGGPLQVQSITGMEIK